MPDYRRFRVPGGTYFFTVNLRDRRSDLLVSRVDLLREAVRLELARRPFHVDAWVVLPEHMHCLWTLPDGDVDYALRWQAIKAGFSRLMGAKGVQTPSLIRRRESGIWQRRYWEHTIRDEQDYGRHMDYIHFNPVKHGLVRHPAEWAFSSFGRCVARGVYPADWGGVDVALERAGERAPV